MRVGSGDVVRQAGERRSARIESLRALAALGVLVAHSWGWAHNYSGTVYATYHARLLLSGGFGVYLFFALSGYLLYLPFARAAFGGGDRVNVARYAMNRALRILPLYYVVMAFYLAVSDHFMRHQWWRFALFLESFSPSTVAKVDGPVWSLVVEVQFYILLPLFAWLIATASRRSMRVALVLLVALALGALAVRVATVTSASPTAVWQYSLPATCVFFFPGFLLALLRVHVDKHGGRWLSNPLLGSSDAWFAGGVITWLIVAYKFEYDATLLIGSALFLGACALPLRPGFVVRALDWRLIAGLGVASYSLYLWHEPMVHRFAHSSWMPSGFVPLVLVSAVVCSLVAVVSYHIIEEPFLRWRRSWSHSRLPDGVIDSIDTSRAVGDVEPAGDGRSGIA